jgi:hypothetical protein
MDKMDMAHLFLLTNYLQALVREFKIYEMQIMDSNLIQFSAVAKRMLLKNVLVLKLKIWLLMKSLFSFQISRKVDKLPVVEAKILIMKR